MTATHRDGSGTHGADGDLDGTGMSGGTGRTDTKENRDIVSTGGDTGNGADEREPGPSAVFRVPATAMIAVLMLFMCMFPFAAAAPALLGLLVIPILLAVWLVRTRTTATRDGLTVRTMLGTRELPWTSIKGFSLSSKSAVSAVLHDDSTVPLPSVRTRHLPVLSLVSEGRVPDPSGALDEPDTDVAESPEDTKNADGAENAKNTEGTDGAGGKAGTTGGTTPASRKDTARDSAEAGAGSTLADGDRTDSSHAETDGGTPDGAGSDKADTDTGGDTER